MFQQFILPTGVLFFVVVMMPIRQTVCTMIIQPRLHATADAEIKSGR